MSYLQGRDLVTLRAVCSTLREIVDSANWVWEKVAAATIGRISLSVQELEFFTSSIRSKKLLTLRSNLSQHLTVFAKLKQLLWFLCKELSILRLLRHIY